MFGRNDLVHNKGEWVSEPNSREWIDPATMLPCRILRHPTLLHLLGYVGAHRDLGHYGQLSVRVHGGLTYSGPEGDIYWYGFDCAHYMDLVPGLIDRDMESFQQTWGQPLRADTRKIYRNWAYVEEQVTSLARQIRDLG